MFEFKLGSVVRRILPIGLFAVAVTLPTPALFGQCVSGTLTSYESGGLNFGCTMPGPAGYTVNFDDLIATSSDAGAILLTPDEIMVRPSFTADSLSFDFSGEFAAAAGDTDTYTIEYTLDPAVPKIKGPGIVTGPNEPVNLQGEFCGGATFAQDSCAGDFEGLGLTGPSVGPVSTSTLFPSPETTLDTRLILTLDASDSSGSTIGYFGSTDTLATPEPSSSLWLAPGLLAFVWLRNKRLANSR